METLSCNLHSPPSTWHHLQLLYYWACRHGYRRSKGLGWRTGEILKGWICAERGGELDVSLSSSFRQSWQGNFPTLVSQIRRPSHSGTNFNPCSVCLPQFRFHCRNGWFIRSVDAFPRYPQVYCWEVSVMLGVSDAHSWCKTLQLT